ncbi:hypothetical protein [Parapedobacter koreensis]|uniref:Uncharacterized protein n=1 Tax=Parapedobacter koreensis TaxID=332977 RepID=A0A1H7Q2H3_9SPHI|nr:hypothetical protein [Parapedobacter koreensis]SEL41527.1 hypothetical protein SAMN05421740_105111 [Parapedobacter koreensis]
MKRFLMIAAGIAAIVCSITFLFGLPANNKGKAPRSTVYHYPHADLSDWNNPERWEEGGSTESCNDNEIPCQVDLDIAGASSIEDLLEEYEENELTQFMSRPGVTGKSAQP